MANLKSQLNDMVKVEGITAAVIVGRDGFVIEGVSSDGSLDVESVGAVISTGLGSSEMMGRELNVGSLTQSMSEFSNGVLVMGTLGKDALLCLVCSLEANLGNVRLQMKKRSPNMVAEL
ncbi:MAG: roadblock/LC7 domain-containing protein [Thermodesulfobacteriota bacterium]